MEWLLCCCLCAQTLVLPSSVQSEVDLQSILVRSKPFSDAEDLQPVCYRCSTTNPLLNTQVRLGSSSELAYYLLVMLQGSMHMSCPVCSLSA